MTQEWHDADAVVEAQEATEDDALSRAAAAAGVDGKQDAAGAIEQDRDLGIAGTPEAAAWTPGRSTEEAAGAAERPSSPPDGGV